MSGGGLKRVAGIEAWILVGSRCFVPSSCRASAPRVQLVCVAVVPNLPGERLEREYRAFGAWTTKLEVNSVFDLESEDEGIFRVL